MMHDVIRLILDAAQVAYEVVGPERRVSWVFYVIWTLRKFMSSELGILGFHYVEDGFWKQIEEMDHVLHFYSKILCIGELESMWLISEFEGLETGILYILCFNLIMDLGRSFEGF